MAKFCLGCLTPLPDGDDVCRVCGFTDADQNPANALPIKALLQDHYVIGRMVHESGDSLSYLAYDKTLGDPCFIQEYYPGSLCTRASDGALTPLEGCDHLYIRYQQEFGKVMRSLAHARDLPCIIPIYDIFEQNGTLYAVSEYLTGETLSNKIKRVGRIPWQTARSMFMPLMECIEQLAAIGMGHYAICPANILIADDGKPYLRGFSLAATRQVGHDLTSRLATGYAAPEQYKAEKELTEATDVYGLAATIFRTVTGTMPPAGNSRPENSDDLFMTADVAEELTKQVCVALFNALQVPANKRTATAKQLHQQLSMEPNVSALLAEDKPVAKKTIKPIHTLLIIFGAVAAALLVILAVILLLLNGGGKQPGTSSGDQSQQTTTTTSATAAPDTTYAVPNLVGKNFYDIIKEKYDGKFDIVIKHKEYNEKKPDIIISQEPAAGEKVKEGATINVIVSLGKSDAVAVPNLRGWKEEHAKLYLQALGFRVDTADLQASDVERGLVDRTDPPAGAMKSRGDTITLCISRVISSDGPSGSDGSSNNEMDANDIPTN